MKQSTCCFLLLNAILIQTVSAADYDKPDLLIEPAQLRAALAKADEKIVVLHAAPAKIYRSSHVPGAVIVDVAEWKAAFGDGQDAVAWSQRIGAAGIDNDARVIVYDERVSPNAARIWWILKYWGVKEAAILNGGLRGWALNAYRHRSTNQDQAPLPDQRLKPTNFVAKPHPQRLKTTQQVLEFAATGGDSIEMIDTRSDREFAAGAVPFAQQCEWTNLVNPKTGRVLPPDQLTALLKSHEISLDKPAVTYCQSGGRASVMAFALELMGAENVSNYYGSMGAWKKRVEK